MDPVVKVLIVSSMDLGPELGRTLLWRSDIDRTFVNDREAAFSLAASMLPNLVVIDGRDGEATLAFVHRLRGQGATRCLSLAVLSRSPSLADEQDLRRAGANLVLSGSVDPVLWDGRIEDLLNVPPRREARIAVKFEVWCRVSPEDGAAKGTSLNLSLRGMLLETPEPLDVGTRLSLRFVLPNLMEELEVVGQVVREATPSQAGAPRCGVEFLILRGDARDRIRAFVESERSQ